MLGTVGGKMGLVGGVVAAVATIEPAIALTPGVCFFEGGCGKFQGVGLAAAALICLSVGLVAGVLIRTLVNRVASPRH